MRARQVNSHTVALSGPRRWRCAMEVIHPRCCGIDISKESVVACLRLHEGRRVKTEVQRFGTTTAELLRLHEWLSQAACPHVAIAYASHCTSLGRCETFSINRSLFDNLTPLAFLGGSDP